MNKWINIDEQQPTEEQKRIEADELAAMDNRQVIQELNKDKS